MKQNILMITFFFALLIGYSQGIEFEQLNWNEVLEKATQNQKPIFVDVYTSWCRPCKMMSSQVFPLSEVGEVYNSKFICVKMDAEKGEGIQMVKDYDIHSYPTYIFLYATGELILKATGSMPQDEFLALTIHVEKELNNPKSITDWEIEYVQKKTDTAFLRLYMEKQALLGKSNAILFDEYLALLPVEQRVSKSIIDIYFREKDNIKIHSLAYSNLKDNRAKFTKLGSICVLFMLSAIENSLIEAIKNRNEKLLEEVIAENEKIPLLFLPRMKEYFYMRYFKATNDLEKFITNAIIYGTWLMNQKANILENYYGYELNSIARDFYEKVTDLRAIKKALCWSKRSLEISPDNYMYLDTYAHLLYKIGKRSKAISQQTKALNLVKKQNEEEIEIYKETLRKMKQREKIWE